MIFNVPNMITIFRILIIPFMSVCMIKIHGSDYQTNLQLSVVAFVLFSVAAASDLIDGYYARKYGQVSLVGKFFDPMADKLIHMAGLVLLIPLGRIAPWAVVVLLFREIFINGLRSMAAGEGIIIDAGILGKTKTAWLNAGIGFLILYHPILENTGHPIRFYLLGTICLYIGMFFSVVSGIQYTTGFFKKLRKK